MNGLESASSYDPYRWLRTGMGVLALLVLEAAWTAPWVARYFAGCSRLTPGWWLAFLLISGVVGVVSAGLLRIRVPDPLRRRAYGLTAIAAWLAVSLAASRGLVCAAAPMAGGARPLALFLLQVPSQAALLLAVYWTWSQAVPLAAVEGLNPAVAGARLRRALLGLGAFLLAFQPPLSPVLLVTITLTVASGLLGAALARASHLGQVRAAARLPFRGRWLLNLAAVCGLVLAIGLLLSAGLAHPSVLGAVGWTLAWLAGIFVAVLTIAARLVIALGALLVGWFQVQVPPGAEVLPAVTAAPAATPVPAAPSAAISYMAAVGQQLELIFSLLILGLLAYFAIRGMGAMGLPSGLGQGGGFESDSPEDGAEAAPATGRVRQAWDGMRRRAEHLLRVGQASGNTLHGLYLQMLALARQRGRPRQPAETPQELLIPLASLFPGGEADLKILTSGFEEARYGGVADTTERLATARGALDSLRQLGKTHGPVLP